MALKEAAREPQSTWFLLARSGNLLLRLRNELRIGEDDSGELILAPTAEQTLLSIIQDDTEIRLSSLRSGWLLRDELTDLPGCGTTELSISSGNTIRLSLPNNVFTLTGDASRYPPATKRITLVEEPPIPTLEIEVPEAKPFTTVQIEVSEAERTATNDDDLADPDIAAVTQELLADIVVAESAPPSAVEVAPALRKPNVVAMVGLVAGLILALVMVTTQPIETTGAAQRAVVEAPEVQPSPTNREIQLISSSASRVAAQTSKPAPKATLLNRTTPPIITPQLTVAVPPRSPVADQHPAASTAADWTAELDSAQQLMDQGILIDTRSINAVNLLIKVLNADPTNERALAMIYDCAMQLLEQARRANSAGDEFLARNLTEEVLAFHPTLPEALELRTQLWNQ